MERFWFPYVKNIRGPKYWSTKIRKDQTRKGSGLWIFGLLFLDLVLMLHSISWEVHTMPRKYGKAAQKSVKRAMHKRKSGTLRSGKKGTTRVKSRKQAIAIGLSEARKKGAKVPRKK